MQVIRFLTLPPFDRRSSRVDSSKAMRPHPVNSAAIDQAMVDLLLSPF